MGSRAYAFAEKLNIVNSGKGASSPERSDDNGGAMRSIGAYLAVVLSVAGVPLVLWAQERPYERWGMHNMWEQWGIGMIGMMLMMLVFWGLLIVALVLGIRWLVKQGREPRTDSALDILRQRYARGEINKEEFETKKRELS